MSNGQVVYFPLSRIVKQPSEIELDERYRMQAEIANYWRNKILNESDPYWRKINIETLKNTFISKWEVVEGGIR